MNYTVRLSYMFGRGGRTIPREVEHPGGGGGEARSLCLPAVKSAAPRRPRIPITSGSVFFVLITFLDQDRELAARLSLHVFTRDYRALFLMFSFGFRDFFTFV